MGWQNGKDLTPSATSAGATRDAGVGGAASAILPLMSILVRSVAIVCLVLVALVVMVVGGEAACGECCDGCCLRADRSEPLGRLIRRILGMFGSSVGPASSRMLIVRLPRTDHGAFAPLSPALAQVSVLRI